MRCLIRMLVIILIFSVKQCEQRPFVKTTRKLARLDTDNCWRISIICSGSTCLLSFFHWWVFSILVATGGLYRKENAGLLKVPLSLMLSSLVEEWCSLCHLLDSIGIWSFLWCKRRIIFIMWSYISSLIILSQ
jgi:hypothetical protein